MGQELVHEEHPLATHTSSVVQGLGHANPVTARYSSLNTASLSSSKTPVALNQGRLLFQPVAAQSSRGYTTSLSQTTSAQSPREENVTVANRSPSGDALPIPQTNPANTSSSESNFSTDDDDDGEQQPPSASPLDEEFPPLPRARIPNTDTRSPLTLHQQAPRVSSTYIHTESQLEDSMSNTDTRRTVSIAHLFNKTKSSTSSGRQSRRSQRLNMENYSYR